MGEDTRLRLAALAAGIACLGLAFGFVTGMPGILMMLMFLGAVVMVPLLVITQGWLGLWLLALGGLWAMGLGTLLGGGFSRADFGLSILVLMGLSALFIAIVPPQVAARRRAAWPFGYLNPRKAAEKAKRERLLLEEEIVYDVGRDRWEDPWDEDDAADEVLPLPRKRKVGR